MIRTAVQTLKHHDKRTNPMARSNEMSMYLTTYVGPYFKVHELPSWVEDRHSNIVSCGRGELFSDDPDDVTYLVPDCKLPGVSRQMRFSRDADMPVVEITEDMRRGESEAFALMSAAFIADCNAKGIEVDIHWGVVCDYS